MGVAASRLLRIGAAILVFSVGCLNAQSVEGHSLKGIKTIGVLVDGLDRPRCGLSADDVTTSVKYVVGESAVTVKDGLQPFMLYVNVNLLDDCSASNVKVEVLTSAMISATGVWVADADIWDKSGLLTGRNQKARILEVIEEDCKNSSWTGIP